MQDIIVSLSKNTLKVTTVGKEGLVYKSSDISSDIANDYLIKDSQKFSEALGELISSVTTTSAKNIAITFLIGPEQIYLKFVTVGKGNENVEEKIIAEIREKLEDTKLEDLYFAYEKIAPFVYQFVGVNKEDLEKYIEVANIMEVSLRGVVPWVLLLPKYTELNDPAIYIVNHYGEQVVALSELNGIFFTEVFETEQDPKELEKLVQQLSVYKRPCPINKIYTLNYGDLGIDSDFTVVPIEVPNADMLEEKGYELNILANYMMDTYSELFARQLNLLNLLPVPVVVKEKKSPVVYAGGVIVAAIVIGGAIFLRSRMTNANPDALANNNQSDTAVLSETSDTPQVTETTDQTDDQQTEDLSREDLSIRVENGAGIPGIAGRTKDRLEELGYVIGDNVGNADDIGSPDTVLRFKKDNVKYADMLKEDMQDVYLSIEVQDDLDENAEYDVLIIVGTDVDE